MPDPTIYLSIVLPVYNGEARLKQTLEEVHEVVQRLRRECEVIAVDDGSTDATAQILRDWGALHPELVLLSHEVNQGKGVALKTGVAASRGRLILTVDADATYSLADTEAFLAALEAGHGASIANRRDPHSRFVLNPRDFAYVGRRHVIGGIYVWIARSLLGLSVSDVQAGFKCYQGEVAREVFPLVEATGFAFDVELLALLELAGVRIAEIPVTLVYRYQPSTVRLAGDGWRMIRRILLVRRKLKRLRRSGGLSLPAPTSTSP